jgi:ligand-binding sensor domain-containing protein
MAGKMSDKLRVKSYELRRIFLANVLIFLWGVLGLGSSSCFAQTPQNQFVFKQLVDNKSTLANSNNCFLEDKDGFLWIGTVDGLKRFDGNDFTIYKHEKNKENSLIHSSVYALCEDKLGRIWTGTEEGIGYFDKSSNKFFNFKEIHKRDFVCFNLLCDSNGDVWFSIRDKGLYRYSERTKKLQNFAFNLNDKTSITSNRVIRKGMVYDLENNGIWLITKVGVNFFDFKTQQFHSRKNNPKRLKIFQFEDVSAIALDKKILVFYDANAQKLKYFDIQKNTITKEITVIENGKKENSDISSIFIDKQQNIWLPTWSSGAFFYNAKTSKISELVHDPAKPNSIAANSFWCVFEQNNGAIWLGTQNGISITNPRNRFYEIYDIGTLYDPLKNENQLHLFSEDSADRSWWLAAKTHSFMHYFPETNQLEVFKIPLTKNAPDFQIEALIEYQNNIFVVTRKLFYLFDKQTKRLTKISIPKKYITEKGISHVTRKGDKIWFFSENFTTFSYEISTKQWKEYPVISDTKIETFVSCSTFDENNDLWITIHATGLAKFSEQKQAFELIKTANEVDFSKIGYFAMQRDSEGNFWLGSYNLIKFNPKTKTFLSELEINHFTDIAFDKEGKIWMPTFNDFTVFYPKNQKTISTSIPINKGNLLWTNHLFLLKNGQIISLMKENIIKLDPTKLIPPSIKDKVLISKVDLANDEIVVHNDASTVYLTASKNGFGILFSTLNPPDEHKYQYLYQLSGYQSDWILTTKNVANFSNLDGGDYVFKVKGIDENGRETAISYLNIHIDTLFYKSKWFLYFCVLAVCILIYAFMKFRANQRSKIIHLQMQSTRLEKDKTEIQYQNLINHLNPHFLFNSLTSLNSLIMTAPKDASKFLQKLSLIYRYILQNKDKEVISLEQELAFVKHYIDLQKSRFEAGLQINIDIEKAYLTSGIVPVTLQNLFENAIKHNSVEEDNPLIISVFVKESYLIVKNNLQRKKFVETSNKQGLDSLKSLYKYLTTKPLESSETEHEFSVKIPLL